MTFELHSLLTGLKDKVDSLLVHDDTLYLAHSSGQLSTYTLHTLPSSSDSPPTLSSRLSTRVLSKRPIEQLIHLPPLNALAALSDSSVTLYTLPEFEAVPLPQSKGATVCATLSELVGPVSVEEAMAGKAGSRLSGVFGHSVSAEKGDKAGEGKEGEVITRLVVGAKRRVVVYTWVGDAERGSKPQGKELPLPHTPRSIALPNPSTAFLAFSPTEYAILSLPSPSSPSSTASPSPRHPTTTFTLTEFTLPNIPTAASASAGGGYGLAGLGGLGGYVGLGGGRAKGPWVVRVGEGEVLVGKDTLGIFLGEDGKPTRRSGIEWPVAPDETTFARPYVFSLLPPSPSPAPQTPTLQIRSSTSLDLIQSLPLPYPHVTALPSTARLLTPTHPARAPLFVLLSPSERAPERTHGAALCALVMRGWATQVDSLVARGRYEEALGVLDSVVDDGNAAGGAGAGTERDETRKRILGLLALERLEQGESDQAVDIWIALDTNPAKVVALWPEEISGGLSVGREGWEELFGGVRKEAEAEERVEEAGRGSAPGKEDGAGVGKRLSSVFGSVTPSLTAAAKDDASDTRSIRSAQSGMPVDDSRRSLESLIRYLTDRRQKVLRALPMLPHPPTPLSFSSPPLSSIAQPALLALPSLSPAQLDAHDLALVARIVDTALFKAYLATRPALVGPLCRIENWCEVGEVEGLLGERKKYNDLVSLYQNKKMHDRALELLHKLSDDEPDPDPELKLGPTIRYLQRLGPEHVDLIFEAARWVFEADAAHALEIFTADYEEVESLPRARVAEYLHELDAHLCATYLEHVIHELGESGPEFHERLAELYLELARDASPDEREEIYARLLDFVEHSQQYRADRILARLPREDMFEARALLLGRIGQHEEALKIYVYRLQDYSEAEAYCTRLYPTPPLFLTLLRLYLRPSPPHQAQLDPALSLLSRHPAEIDLLGALDLLPPLVGLADTRTFLERALRAGTRERLRNQVGREVVKARLDQVGRGLMGLQSRRVRITESRTCPQCHKRLGNSVIAVHAPRGEVTHLGCKDEFGRKLAEELSFVQRLGGPP